jgi:hypothetical protein
MLSLPLFLTKLGLPIKLVIVRQQVLHPLHIQTLEKYCHYWVHSLQGWVEAAHHAQRWDCHKSWQSFVITHKLGRNNNNKIWACFGNGV